MYRHPLRRAEGGIAANVGVRPGNRYPRKPKADDEPGILRKVAAGIAAPFEQLYDVSQGDYSPLGVEWVDGEGWVQSPEKAIPFAVDVAGLGATGGLATAGLRPTGVGIFGGRLAKTADLEALSRAEKMAAEGASRDAIWNETGWFQGADGKWRFEIPDHAAATTAKAWQGSIDDLSANLDHPAAYEAYPDLAHIPSIMAKSKGHRRGSLQEDGDQLTLTAMGDSPFDMTSVALHEMQHAIQKAEGTAPGGSPQYGHPREDVWRAAKGAYEDAAADDDLLRDLGVDVPESKAPRKSWDDLSDREKLEWLDRGRSRIYHRLAGEVEARNVQERMLMSASERRARPPWTTQSIPDEDQIIRMSLERTPKMATGGIADADMRVTVAKGDNPTKIARRALPKGASESEVAALANAIVKANGVNARRIKPGQVLIVPGIAAQEVDIPLPRTRAEGIAAVNAPKYDPLSSGRTDKPAMPKATDVMGGTNRTGIAVRQPQRQVSTDLTPASGPIPRIPRPFPRKKREDPTWITLAAEMEKRFGRDNVQVSPPPTQPGPKPPTIGQRFDDAAGRDMGNVQQIMSLPGLEVTEFPTPARPQDPYEAQRRPSTIEVSKGIAPPPGWAPKGGETDTAFRPPHDQAYEWFHGHARGYTGERGAFPKREFMPGEERSLAHGLIKSAVPGRTDQLPITVPRDSYIIPADVISGLGQGNTDAGWPLFRQILAARGVEVPDDGAEEAGPGIDIIAAGGEGVVHPAVIASLGGGDVRKGHKMLDDIVLAVRKQTAKRLSQLPGPKK